MTVQEIKASLRSVPGKVPVVYCDNPGAGAFAKEVVAVMETKVNVTRDGVTSLESVVVLVGSK